MPITTPVRHLPVATLAAPRRTAGHLAGLLSALSLTAAGCHAIGGTNAAPGRPALPAEGVVARVNAEHDFVILDCYVLPRPGEEMTIWRQGRRVAIVRVTNRRRPPFVAADIVAGTPRRGDTARGEHWAPTEEENNKP